MYKHHSTRQREECSRFQTRESSLPEPRAPHLGISKGLRLGGHGTYPTRLSQRWAPVLWEKTAVFPSPHQAQPLGKGQEFSVQ